MNRIAGKFEFWNEQDRIAVCPVDTYHGDTEEIVRDLEKIDCKILGLIDMPIKLTAEFVVAKIPDWLTAEADEETWNSYEFKDSKGRVRISTVGCTYFKTWVTTRYYATDVIRVDDIGKFVPCVFDRESDFDEDGDGEPIWQGKPIVSRNKRIAAMKKYDVGGFGDSPEMHIAAEWLDKNYPDWRNPAAYWTP